ncbi:Phospholipase A2 group XV [Pseudolycoriella hygida]|uniref:Phospholipase A2 group XV n=1 Tax=Pseudolycoriella hygida TaxID=35572 RepID=A0A9Q0N9R7_9DIPT|nr:Phospholipase A2 group XV [Pseudolycoriella hygida]
MAGIVCDGAIVTPSDEVLDLGLKLMSDLSWTRNSIASTSTIAHEKGESVAPRHLRIYKLTFRSFSMHWNVFGFALYVFCYKCGFTSTCEKNGKPLSPVIFVPGKAASQIEAKLDKPNTVRSICYEKTVMWYSLWLNPEILLPFVIDCWVDNMSLTYDNNTRTTRNSPGVETRVSGWGDPESVEWMNPLRFHFTAYFKDIGNALVANGYVRNVSIRGAPYDFRKAPNENRHWFVDLKTLVEETYETNGKVAVTLIAHSMGARMTLLFLHQQDKSWKRKYISRIISLSGAWGGSVKALKLFATGDNLGSFVISESAMKRAQITFPSLAFLLPSPVFWNTDEILVQTQRRAYTLSHDLNYTIGWEMRKDTLKYIDFTPPGVEVHCLYGADIPTVEKLNYPSEDLNSYPTSMNGDGDGSVNERSLEGCTHWIGLKEQLYKNISTLRLPDAEHQQILSDNRAIQSVTMRGNSGFLRLAVIWCLLVCSVSGGVPRLRRMMRETFASPVEEVFPVNVTLSSDKCSYNGKEVERSSVTCEKKNGCREIETHGECCPKFACECKLNGTTYDNGDKIVDPENPCEVCVCRGGDINCNALKCYTRNDCKNVTYTPGVCCPEYGNCPPLENVELSTNETSTIASFTDYTSSSVLPSSETPTSTAPTSTTPQLSTSSNDNPVGIKIKEITKPEEIRITDDRPKVFQTIKSSETIALQTSPELQSPEAIIEPEHEAPLVIDGVRSEIEPEIEQHTTFSFDGSADQQIQLESTDLNTEGDVSIGPKTVRQTDLDMDDEIHTTDAPFPSENEIKNDLVTTKLSHVTEGPLEPLPVERNTSVLQIGDSVVIFDRSGQTQSIPLNVAGLQRGDEDEEDERKEGRKTDETGTEGSSTESLLEHSTSNEVFEVYYYEPKEMSTVSLDFALNEASGEGLVDDVKLRDDLKEGSADLQNIVASTEKDDFDHSSGYSPVDRFTDPMLAEQSTVNEKTMSYDFEGSTSTSEEMTTTFDSFPKSTSPLLSSEATTTEDDDIVQHDQNINFPHITDDLSIHGRMDDRMDDDERLRPNNRVTEIELEKIKIIPVEANSITASEELVKTEDELSLTTTAEGVKGSTNFKDVEGRSPGEPLLIPEWERNHTTVAPIDLSASSNETTEDLLAELSSRDRHTSDTVVSEEPTTNEPDVLYSSTVVSEISDLSLESGSGIESEETSSRSSQAKETNNFKLFLEGTEDFFKIQSKLWN